MFFVFGFVRRNWTRRYVPSPGRERSRRRMSGFLRSVSASALLPSAASMTWYPFMRKNRSMSRRNVSDGSAIRICLAAVAVPIVRSTREAPKLKSPLQAIRFLHFLDQRIHEPLVGRVEAAHLVLPLGREHPVGAVFLEIHDDLPVLELFVLGVHVQKVLRVEAGIAVLSDDGDAPAVSRFRPERQEDLLEHLGAGGPPGAPPPLPLPPPPP